MAQLKCQISCASLWAIFMTISLFYCQAVYLTITIYTIAKIHNHFMQNLAYTKQLQTLQSYILLTYIRRSLMILIILGLLPVLLFLMLLKLEQDKMVVVRYYEAMAFLLRIKGTYFVCIVHISKCAPLFQIHVYTW